MTSNRFYINSKNIHASVAILEAHEHHHLKNVSRICPGDIVWLFDEGGISYSARVEAIEQKRTRLVLLSRHERPELRVEVTLAQGLAKSKKLEMIIQKATELCLHTFLPVMTERSQVKIENNAAEKKLARWAKIAREAAKQSGLPSIPSILHPKSLSGVLEGNYSGMKIYLSEHGGKPFREILAPVSPSKSPDFPPSAIIILIGPEGGWTEKEEQDIVTHGFEAVSLGRQILRVETAAISSLALIDHFWNQCYVP